MSPGYRITDLLSIKYKNTYKYNAHIACNLLCQIYGFLLWCFSSFILCTGRWKKPEQNNFEQINGRLLFWIFYWRNHFFFCQFGNGRTETTNVPQFDSEKNNEKCVYWIQISLFVINIQPINLTFHFSNITSSTINTHIHHSDIIYPFKCLWIHMIVIHVL